MTTPPPPADRRADGPVDGPPDGPAVVSGTVRLVRLARPDNPFPAPRRPSPVPLHRQPAPPRGRPGTNGGTAAAGDGSPPEPGRGPRARPPAGTGGGLPAVEPAAPAGRAGGEDAAGKSPDAGRDGPSVDLVGPDAQGERPVTRRVTRTARLRSRQRRERVGVGVPVVLLVAVLVALLPGGGVRAQSVPLQIASGPGDAAAEAVARRFLDRYVDPDGRVVRHDQGGDTVSEGQAYGLLLTAAIGDRERFERIWTWTRTELQRSDGLLSWHWRNGAVVDPEPAADADIDVANALIVGAARFDDPSLTDEALRIALAVRARETAETARGPVLVAGPWAVSPTPTVNPSYFDPEAFARLGALTGQQDWWARLTEGGYAVVDGLRAEHALPPDWALVTEEGPRAVPAPGSSGGTPRYGLDAARLPVRFAAACDPAARRRAAALWPVLRDVPLADHVQIADLQGRPVTQTRHPLPLVAAAAVASAAGEPDRVGPLLDAAEQLDARAPGYYGAAWTALGRVLLTTDLLGAC